MKAEETGNRMSSDPKAEFSAHLDAAKLMKDWAVWMIGVPTAAIGGLIFVPKEKVEIVPWLLYTALFFLILAIAMGAWLIGCLPSVTLRQFGALYPDSTIGREYRKYAERKQYPIEQALPLYDMRIYTFIPITVARIAFFMHVSILIGVVTFAVLVGFGATSKSQSDKPSANTNASPVNATEKR